MKLDIKPAQISDAPVLAQIMTEALQKKLRHHDKAWGTQPYTAQELSARIKAGHTYAAWHNATIVATLELVWEDVRTWGRQPPIAAYVHQLAVRDGYRGIDVGKWLLEWAAQQALKQGRTHLRLDVPTQNTKLRNYYEQCGFTWIRNTELHNQNEVFYTALYERSLG